MSVAGVDPLDADLPGLHLIEASAGTGKTHTISSLYLRLLLVAGLAHDRILVVTFTEAATAELRDRIRRRLRTALATLDGEAAGDEQVERILSRVDPERARLQLVPALRQFDLAAISTIHGFCQRVLLENAFESGIPFDAELEPDLGELQDEIIADFWAGTIYEAPALFVTHLEQNRITPSRQRDLVRISLARPDSRLLPRDVPDFAPGAALADAFARARDCWRRDSGEVIRMLNQDPGVNRRRYTKTKLPAWLDQVDAFFAGPLDQASVFPKGVQMVTRSALGEKPAKKAPPPQHVFFDVCDALVRVPAEQSLAMRVALARFARDELRQRKASRGLLSFDDLLLRLDAALRGPGGPALTARTRERFGAALIDEFQDTDQVQYRILRSVFAAGDEGGPPTFLIGDPKQSIYAFRGADIYAYLDAVADAGRRRLTLGQNWRSDPGLIEAVNHLFGRHPDPFGFDEIGYRPIRPCARARDRLRAGEGTPAALQLRFLRRDGLENDAGVINKGTAEDVLPALVAGDVRHLLTGDLTLDGRALKPGDVALLVRTNRQAAQFQEALRAQGVASVLVSMQSVYTTREADELSLLLRAVADAGDANRLRAALATQLLGLGGAQIQALGRDESSWQAMQDQVRDWRMDWETGGVLRMLRAVLAWRPTADDPSRLARLLSLPDGERRVSNINHLAELLQAASSDHQLGPAALIRWFDQRRLSDAQPGDATQLRLESDEHAVKLVTIHRSKGLQYPIVYCPTLWDGAGLNGRKRKPAPVAFHDREQNNRAMLDLGSRDLDAHRAQARTEAFAESLRMVYVALTRAENLCVVAWGAVSSMENTGLAYLLHHPEQERDPERMARRVKELSDEELLADLEELAAGARGCVSVGPFNQPPSGAGAGGRSRAHRLGCPTASRGLSRSPLTTSFTALVAAGAELTPDEEAGLDHDLAEEGGAEREPEAGPAAAARRRVPLADLRRGARTGDMLHWLFEHADFQSDAAELARSTQAALVRHGFDPEPWRAPLAAAVGDVLATPLWSGAQGLRLVDVPARDRLTELEFLFRVDCSGGLGPGLAGLMARLSGPGVPAEYPARLSGLGRRALSGYMRGFIDLVFVHAGRWYLVDYKSNHLGDHFSEYASDRLLPSMQQHHYLLQYHIYCVALHRYLSVRLGPEYDPERHLGGVFYLFLRGMSPEAGAGFGVFADRPPGPLIQAMSDLLGGEAMVGGGS